MQMIIWIFKLSFVLKRKKVQWRIAPSVALKTWALGSIPGRAWFKRISMQYSIIVGKRIDREKIKENKIICYDILCYNTL